MNKKEKSNQIDESGHFPFPRHPEGATAFFRHPEGRSPVRIHDSESGRSMTEMLGTLAIMGVLAIGGIAGYRFAMDKYKANDILNEVRKLAVMASQQRVTGRDTITFDEYGNTVSGYALDKTEDYNGDSNFFTISVTGIEKEICQNVIAQKMPLSVDMWVDPDSDECEGDTNTVIFAFSNTLDPNALQDIGNGDNPQQPTCENGYVLDDGTCVVDEICDDPKEFWNGDPNCVPCPTTIGAIVEKDSSDLQDSCGKCENMQVFAGLWSFPTYCIYCPNPGIVCGSKCCAKGEKCQINNYTTTYSCVSTGCTTDSDCANASVTGTADEGKKICDTFTGQCQWGCKDNGDCQTGYFCDLNTSTTSGSCTQKPKSGTCKEATYLDETGIELETVVGTAKKIYRSSGKINNWWSAENFCAAKGLKLIDPKAYCEAEEWKSIKENRYQGYCNKLNTNSYSGWTKTLKDSCNALYIYNNKISYTSRYNYNTVYALCEGTGSGASPEVSGYIPPEVSGYIPEVSGF